VTDDLFRYIRTARAEAAGHNRKEAIANAFAFMDAHSKGRKRKAAERYEVVRVSRLGPGWWNVAFRPRRRKQADA
jgi:hypothetical protein